MIKRVLFRDRTDRLAETQGSMGFHLYREFNVVACEISDACFSLVVIGAEHRLEAYATLKSSSVRPPQRQFASSDVARLWKRIGVSACSLGASRSEDRRRLLEDAQEPRPRVRTPN